MDSERSPRADFSEDDKNDKFLKSIEYNNDTDDGRLFKPTMYESKTVPSKQQWMTDLDEEQFKILDPDDPLMKRFQDALKSHLLRIDNKLSEEISELVRNLVKIICEAIY